MDWRYAGGGNWFPVPPNARRRRLAQHRDVNQASVALGNPQTRIKAGTGFLGQDHANCLGVCVFYWSKLLAPFAPRAGRCSQSSYLTGFTLPFIVLLGVSWLVLFGAPGLLGTPGYYAVALGWTYLLATGDAYNVRRWRDLGNSGALYKLLRPGVVLLPVLAIALQFVIPAQLASAGDMEALAFMMSMEFGGFRLQPVPTTLLAITVIGVTGNVIYLSLMPGTIGPNAFGEDPRSGGIPVKSLMPSGNAQADTAGDPVERALREYRERSAQAAAPVAARALASQKAAARPSAIRPTGGAVFGKKR